MKQAALLAFGLMTACAMSSACASDEWERLAAERLRNVADSRFADDRARVLETLTLLSTAYRAQHAYGKEALVRRRELRLWFSLRAPARNRCG